MLEVPILDCYANFPVTFILRPLGIPPDLETKNLFAQRSLLAMGRVNYGCFGGINAIKEGNNCFPSLWPTLPPIGGMHFFFIDAAKQHRRKSADGDGLFNYLVLMLLKENRRGDQMLAKWFSTH